MRRGGFLLWTGMLAGLVALPSLAQDPPPRTTLRPPSEEVKPLPVPEGAPDEIVELVRDLATEGVTVDFERRRIDVKGVVLLDRMNSGYPIEYLMVTDMGRAHESLCMVRCTPSKLNAAFLALGLTPGKTVEFKKREPTPPLEKLMSGEEREYDVIPPRGPLVDLSVIWRDEQGAVRMHPIEDLIVYVTNGRPIPRRGFVYVGSKFGRVLIGTERQERFMADVEGNLVSLYLSGFGTCLFDHNSAEGAEGFMYDINTELAPPAGTIATFRFQLR